MPRKPNTESRPCVVCATEHYRPEPSCGRKCQALEDRFLPAPDKEGVVPYWCWHGQQPRHLLDALPGEARVYSPVCDRWHSPAPLPRPIKSVRAKKLEKATGSRIVDGVTECLACAERFGGQTAFERHIGTGLPRGKGRGAPKRCLRPDEWTLKVEQDESGIWRRPTPVIG